MKVWHRDVNGRNVMIVKAGLADYLYGLVRYLNENGGVWRRPWDLLARAYVKTTQRGTPVITFRGNAIRDNRLGAHELGHVLGFEHPGEMPRDFVLLFFNIATHTTMHPWGMMRKKDPEGLISQWRKIAPPEAL